MRTSFAIILLVIHLFSLAGYRLVFSYAENSADKSMDAKVDNNSYDDHDLLQIRLALSMPYITNSTSYERCYGKVEYNGVQYNYVKRMIHNDTLYLLCIRNNKKTSIAGSKNLCSAQSAESAPGKKQDQSFAKKNAFQTDYYSSFTLFNIGSQIFQTGKSIASESFSPLCGFSTQPVQPPDLMI